MKGEVDKTQREEQPGCTDQIVTLRVIVCVYLLFVQQ